MIELFIGGLIRVLFDAAKIFQFFDIAHKYHQILLILWAIKNVRQFNSWVDIDYDKV